MERFNFDQTKEWPRWIQRFERFRQASGLCDKSQESQVNTLIYAMRDEADDILGSLDLTDVQKLVYDTVQEAFQNHFIKKRNPIFECARLNQRKQEGESVDSFITALCGLAKHCDYGALHDQMIRDRLVVGLRDAALSEKLQMDADLSLQTAISTARQRESVRKQQSVVRGDNQLNVDAVRAKIPYQGKSGKKKGPSQFSNPPPKVEAAQKICTGCERAPSHGRDRCPAREATYHKCQKKRHFQSQCWTKGVHAVQVDDDIFIATIHDEKHSGDNPWEATISVNGLSVTFKIDTGADVSVTYV